MGQVKHMATVQTRSAKICPVVPGSSQPKATPAPMPPNPMRRLVKYPWR